MSSGNIILNQPGVYLVDADGNTATLGDGDAIGTAEALIVAGKDGTVARFLAVDSSGKLAIQDPPNLDAALSTLATEAKLELVRALLATIDSDTSNLDVLLSSRASESTLATLATETKLEAVRVLLASLEVKDFATQATLAAADAKLATIDGVLDSIKDNDGIKKITDPVVLGASNASLGKIKIEDGYGAGFIAAVDSSSRLVVSSNATIVPAAAVAVNIEEVSDLIGTDDNVYIIPSGKQLTISRFAGGSEGNSGKVSKISLFDDPNGNGTGMITIRSMYVGTSNWEFTLDFKVTGDGTHAIRMRRERLDGASDEVAGFWDGFRDV